MSQVMEFGAFVSIEGFSRDGLIHVTQMKHAEDGERVFANECVTENQVNMARPSRLPCATIYSCFFLSFPCRLCGAR